MRALLLKFEFEKCYYLFISCYCQWSMALHSFSEERIYRKVQELEESLQSVHVLEADIGYVQFRGGREVFSKVTAIFIFIEWALYAVFNLSFLFFEFTVRHNGAHFLFFYC